MKKETMELDLQPARRVTKSEHLFEQFSLLFKNGKLSPGMKLPPERELAEMLEVSRPTVREMIKAFALLGVVEQTQGSGTIVKRQLTDIAIQPSMFELALESATMQELTEMRIMIEPELAALAAQRAGEEDILIMERLCQQYERHLTSNDAYSQARLIKVSKEFHSAIAQAANNRIALECLERVSTLLTRSREQSVMTPGSTPRGAMDHKLILEAIRNRDPEHARENMRVHILHVAEDLLNAYPAF